jgi:uncharacterized alpha-E superfamily protein
MHAISGTPAELFRNPAEQLLAQLCAELAYAQIDDIVGSGLHEYLDELQTNMNQVGARVAETFFAAHMTTPNIKKRLAPRK